MGQTISALLSTQLTGWTCLLQQAAKGEIDLRVIAADPLLLLHTNRSGQNLAHIAARAGYLELLRLLVALLDEHSDAVAAAVSKHLQEQGAKQAGMWWRPSKCLPWIRGCNAQQLLDLQQPALVTRAVLSWQSCKGVTPLMLACRSGHADCVAVLLDNGADPVLLDKATRRSCLHYAATTGYATCINVLLNEFRTVRAFQDSSSSNSEVLLQDVLLRDGGEVWKICRFVDLRNSSGFGALHYAAFWGHTSVVRALLAAGASVMLKTANGMDRPSTDLMVDRGNAPLHLAAENGHVMTAATLLTAHAEVMSQRFPASVHQQQQQQPWEGQPRQDPRAALNSNGDTPQALAVAGRRSKALIALLDPHMPLLGLLQSVGLVGSRLLGVPKLSVLAKGVLDQHLSNCLHVVEAERQQKAAAAAAAAAAIKEALEEEDTFAFDDNDAEWHTSRAELLGHAAAPPPRTALAKGRPCDNSAAAAAVSDKSTSVQKSSIAGNSTSGGPGTVSLSAFCICGPIRPSSSASSLAGVLGSSSSSSATVSDSGRPVDSKAVPGWDTTHCSSSSTTSGDSTLATAEASAEDASDNNSSSSSSACCDVICNICFDEPSDAALAGCKHRMCVGCARLLVAATTTVKPAVCPYCRRAVSGFVHA